MRPFDAGVDVGPVFDRSAFEAVATAVRQDENRGNRRYLNCRVARPAVGCDSSLGNRGPRETRSGRTGTARRSRRVRRADARRDRPALRHRSARRAGRRRCRGRRPGGARPLLARPARAPRRDQVRAVASPAAPNSIAEEFRDRRRFEAKVRVLKLEPRSAMPPTSWRTATSSSGPSGRCRSTIGRSSSSITTSACRSTRPPRASGSRPGPPSRGSTTRSRPSGRRSNSDAREPWSGRLQA